MADSEPDDTELLTTALEHYWAWYDGGYERAFEILNYYLVAIAILFTAYTSAINGKHYGLAAALSVAGIGLTALTATVVLAQATDAGLAQSGLTELQNRMAGRLRIDPIGAARFPAGTTRRRVAVGVTFGLAVLLQVGGLLYALIH